MPHKPDGTVALLVRGLTLAERDQLREIAWKGRTSVAVLIREMIRTKLHAVNRAKQDQARIKKSGYAAAPTYKVKPGFPVKGD